MKIDMHPLKIFAPLALCCALVANPALAAVTTEFNSWTYHKEWDRLSNREYSLARSPLPKRNLYDLMRLEIVCKNDQLQLVIDSNSLITSQDRAFDFEYQIDSKTPITIQMRTFPDSKRRGYSDEHAREVAEAILAGDTLFIRIHTLIRKVLSGAMPLNDADEPIGQVLADCGISRAKDRSKAGDYTFSDFESDFGKLSEAQQQQVLEQIKRLLDDLPNR
ncbi:MAG: hypothetical protein Kow0065_18000 [Methylomicrobium sp.]